jgi:hypothetical protein
MKFIFKLITLFVIMFGVVSPTYAISYEPLPTLPNSVVTPTDRPRYYNEYKFVRDNKCDAVSVIPYSGIVLYECPSGQSFWSSVLVPSEKSPLFMYFKNRKHQNDDDASDAAAIAAASASYTSY